MNSLKKFFVLTLAFLSLTSLKKQQNDEWVYERERKGIKVFTRKGKWGRLRDARAVMLVNNTPEQILKVLTDFEHYTNWFPRCSKSRMVARFSDNEFIAHLHFNAPWPIKDRDCVIRVKIERDKYTGAIIVTETSEPKYIREDEDVVRITQILSVWKLTPKSGGTEVINEYASNPGGNIPDWMTNSQSVDNPLSTFENLQDKASLKK